MRMRKMLCVFVCLVVTSGIADEEGMPALSSTSGWSTSDNQRTPLLLDFGIFDLPFGKWDICGLGVGLFPGVKGGNTYKDSPFVWGIECGVGTVARKLYGMQISGTLNESWYVQGVQVGLINQVHNSFEGVQIGLYNEAGSSGGGLQIGLINVVKDRTWGFMPILNVLF